jgi:hypothetical protein
VIERSPANLLDYMLRHDIRRVYAGGPDEIEELFLEVADQFGIKAALAEAAFRRANLRVRT